jgi:hypothetical protein
MAITLGRDVSVSIGGSMASARSVSISYTAKLVDVNAWGSDAVQSYSAGYDATASVEINDVADASGAIDNIQSGAVISISGGASGISFQGVISSVTESASVDGVATVVIEARQGRPGL